MCSPGSICCHAAYQQGVNETISWLETEIERIKAERRNHKRRLKYRPIAVPPPDEVTALSLIGDLSLTPATLSALYRDGIATVGELALKKWSELLGIRQVGEGRASEICDALERRLPNYKRPPRR